MLGGKLVILLTIEGVLHASEVFAALAANGEVRMAFAETFWSPDCGALIDHFAIPWEINSVQSDASA